MINPYFILAGIAIVGVVWGHGYMTGSSSMEAEWNESIATQKETIQAEKDRLQDEINQKSADYEKLKASRARKSAEIKRSLDDEIAKTPHLRNCVATAGLVRISEDTLSNKDEPAR